jgi:hypothetical protein
MKAPVLFLALAAGLALTAQPVRADDPAVPGGGFPASRYEALWTKSPFAVATSEAAPESPDYVLVGIANVDGISYASLIESQNQEHFLISSDKPIRGLTLTSITRNHDDTYAVVQRDGQPITLKLEQPPPMPATPGTPPVSTVAMPGSMTPQIPMPGAGSPTTGSVRPLLPARIHRPPIHLPPPSTQQQQPAPIQTVPPPPH